MSRPDIVKRLRVFGAHDSDDYEDAAIAIESLRKMLRKIVRTVDSDRYVNCPFCADSHSDNCIIEKARSLLLEDSR